MIPLTCLLNYRFNILRDATPSYDDVRNNIRHNLKMLNCSNVVYWSDTDCENNFDPLQRFFFVRETDGRLKSDMCRLKMLQIHGGVYIDNDIRLLSNPFLHIPSTTTFASVWSYDRRGIFQAFLATSKDNPILKNTLTRHVQYYTQASLGNTQEITRVTGNIAKPNIGTVLLKDEFDSRPYRNNVVMFQEKYNDLHRCHRFHHLCDYVVFAGNEIIMMSRHKSGSETCEFNCTKFSITPHPHMFGWNANLRGYRKPNSFLKRMRQMMV